MTPALSIVIPYRNDREFLPRMLRSIQVQSLKELEVVIVDDCSEEPCDDIVRSFIDKGMQITLLQPQQRLYSKDARLFGIEHAKAEIIAFADADDIFWGDNRLELHVDQYIMNHADLLQFGAVELNPQSEILNLCCHQHLAKELTGKEIFKAYLTGNKYGIWEHLFSRELWLKIMPYVRPVPVTHHSDDLCLLVYYYHQATKYIGSPHIGYGYYPSEERRRAFSSTHEASVNLYTLLRYFSQYLKDQQEHVDVIKKIQDYILHSVNAFAGRTSITYTQQPELLEKLSEAEIMAFLPCAASSVRSNTEKVYALQKLIMES